MRHHPHFATLSVVRYLRKSVKGPARVQPAGKSRLIGWHAIAGAIVLCLVAGDALRSYLTVVWQLEEVASTAEILATVRVDQITSGNSPSDSPNRTVLGRAELLVLRAYPPSALLPGQHLQLEYEQRPDGNLTPSGPDVPPLHIGSIFVVPLKPNPTPDRGAWRLIADEGIGTVIPAIEHQVPFPAQPKNKREYLLQEVAAALAAGSPAETVREASYLAHQTTNGYAPEIMELLDSPVNGNTERWALIAASLVSALGIPRPTIADFISGRYDASVQSGPGSLAEFSVRRVARSDDGKRQLIHQFLNLSDLNEWGTGPALQEFAQSPLLVKELRSMLQDQRPGSLYVAYDVLKAGQSGIATTAVNTAFAYVNGASHRRSDLQAACWVIRDFSTDKQYAEFITDIKGYQYRDQKRYDELWRNTIWSDNERERAVLDILRADQRADSSGIRYRDIATSELARLDSLKRP